MTTRYPFALAVVALALVPLAACAKKPPATAAAAAPAPPAPAPAPPPGHAASAAPAPDDVLTVDLATLNRRGYLSDAYFDFQEAELRPDARTAIARDADWLRRYPSIQILLEGHCDERGTDAYNLALGERRANTVREYLVSLGVSGPRVRTISYGKERPFCDAETEGCWQENRRAHFVVTAR